MRDTPHNPVESQVMMLKISKCSPLNLCASYEKGHENPSDKNTSLHMLRDPGSETRMVEVSPCMMTACARLPKQLWSELLPLAYGWMQGDPKAWCLPFQGLQQEGEACHQTGARPPASWLGGWRTLPVQATVRPRCLSPTAAAVLREVMRCCAEP